MIPAMQTYHQGWIISTACWDESPPEWKPGDLFQCCASGKAELILPHAYSGAWLSKSTIIAPADKSALFTDFNVAHSTIAKALRGMIDALKAP
jgi:hypothetical protein